MGDRRRRDELPTGAEVPIRRRADDEHLRPLADPAPAPRSGWSGVAAVAAAVVVVGLLGRVAWPRLRRRLV